jgi:hypothetical protein
MDSQPTQILDHGADKFSPGALRIQILIPQNQSSVIVDCPLCPDPESPRMAKVQ